MNISLHFNANWKVRSEWYGNFYDSDFSLFYEIWQGTEVDTYYVRCDSYAIWPQIEILKIQANNQELLMNDGNIYRYCNAMWLDQDQALLQISCKSQMYKKSSVTIQKQ